MSSFLFIDDPSISCSLGSRELKSTIDRDFGQR